MSCGQISTLPCLKLTVLGCIAEPDDIFLTVAGHEAGIDLLITC
jgi:hypothetical protein